MKNDQTTRRTFLKSSVCTASGLLVPGSSSNRGLTGKHFEAEFDIIIAGGGPAGTGAAAGAGKAGASVLLLERYGFFGGIASYGMGMSINQMRPGGKGRGIVHEKIIERLMDYGEDALLTNGEFGPNFRFEAGSLNCNTEYLKVAVMDVLDDFGCPYRLHCPVVDSIVENDRLTGVVISTKEGLKKIGTKVVVDASGDADVAFFAGAETLKGKEDDGFLSPMTLNFIIANVDVHDVRKTVADPKFKEKMRRARDKYPLFPESFNLRPIPLKNAVSVNHAGTKALGAIDGTHVEDITKAETYSRRQIIQMVHALREFGGEAFRNAQLAAAGPQIGVRETRRVKGEYILTEEDAMSGKRFDDAVAWRSGVLDIGFTRMDRTMKVHDVPYRALLPEKLEGLLVAGRCISTTHVAAAAGKSMGNCMATGHAAGVAAALSVKKRIMPRDLNVKELQALLKKDGVELDMGSRI